MTLERRESKHACTYKFAKSFIRNKNVFSMKTKEIKNTKIQKEIKSTNVSFHLFGHHHHHQHCQWSRFRFQMVFDVVQTMYVCM